MWQVTTGIPVLTAHVNIDRQAQPSHVLNSLQTYLQAIGIKHSTIQICNPEPGV